MGVRIPRLVIAGLSGDAGKTIVSLSLISALNRRKMTIAPFKKGPDYIDSAWLTAAAGRPCRNLDTYLADEITLRESFVSNAANTDIAIIEGNRGLFDGKDVIGSHSTAGLAKLLQAPVLLVVDTTKTTRTVAALVKGVQVFGSDLDLAGVILNRVAGKRHRKIITETIEKYCGLPVLGAIPKLGADAGLIPGRHLGLVPPAEYPDGNDFTATLAELAERYLELDRIVALARDAEEIAAIADRASVTPRSSVKIGYFKDSVFTFYYPENLEALEANGATLIPVSSLADSALPEIDALYIGGGFPETHAAKLAENRSLMASVKTAADEGLPIYAECGGLIYLCRSLCWEDQTFPMAGVFQLDLEMRIKPVGHGYSLLRSTRANPYFEVDEEIRGHEFHYSGIVGALNDDSGCLSVVEGAGLGNGFDGLLYLRTMACYTHIHASGNSRWAEAFTRAARNFARERKVKAGNINRSSRAVLRSA